MKNIFKNISFASCAIIMSTASAMAQMPPAGGTNPSVAPQHGPMQQHEEHRDMCRKEWWESHHTQIKEKIEAPMATWKTANPNATEAPSKTEAKSYMESLREQYKPEREAFMQKCHAEHPKPAQ